MIQPPICCVCSHREVRTGLVCDPDRTRIAHTLDEIVELYATLDDQLVPGQTAGQRVSGSREAPLPLRVDPFDLGMPARVPEPTPAARRWPEDQLGTMSVASRLDSWVQDWRDVLGVHTNPEPTVPALAAWLRTWLYVACDAHKAIDEFHRELVALVATLRRTCGTTDVRPELLDAECSRCDQRAMYRLPGEDRVECGGCGRRMTEDEYAQWCRMLVADLKERMSA